MQDVDEMATNLTGQLSGQLSSLFADIQSEELLRRSVLPSPSRLRASLDGGNGRHSGLIPEA